MTKSKKFDCKKLEKLNNPERVKILNPDLIWKNFNLSDPQLLVDIGAGTGFFASFFCKKMNQGKIYACDNSEIMINWLKENLANQGNCSIISTKSEESSIPLSDNIADLVYLINVYHELEEPDKLLSEAYRLLKNGGKIAIIDWAKAESPQGPPISIRIPENDVIENIKKQRFLKIETHNVLPYHYFIIAEK